MRPDRIRRIGSWVLACAAVAALAFFTAGLWHEEGGGADVTTPASLTGAADPLDNFVRDAAIGALEKKYYEEGVNVSVGCLEFDDVAAIIHPDTDPARKARIIEEMRAFYAEQAGRGKTNFNKAGRWTATATDGTVPSEGTPVTLLWGFMPDGITIPASYPGQGEVTGPNVLNAVFDTAFATPAQWKNKMRNVFVRWGDLLGTTYIEVSYDDGAGFPSSPGIVGTRPDIRIGGHSIDGSNGILAYNYYPNNGDQVIDTDDYGFFSSPADNFKSLKNTVMHEHGHGLGLGHVIPENHTKLMEATYSPFADIGPQDDDIRGAQRIYGDWLEENDVVADASVLGAVVDSLRVENVSIDRGSNDEDFYQVTMSSSGIEIVVAPVGSSYMLGDEGGSSSPIATDSITDLDVDLYDSSGTNLIASATGGGVGATEVISGIGLPYAGDYIIRVYRKAGEANAIQRYTLTVSEDASDAVAAGDGVPSARSLGLLVSPNPFNPLTKISFTVPAAGEYSVDVYDISGRLVRAMEGRATAAGPVEVQWDGTDRSGAAVGSGVYLMRVSAGDLREVRRATLVR